MRIIHPKIAAQDIWTPFDRYESSTSVTGTFTIEVPNFAPSRIEGWGKFSTSVGAGLLFGLAEESATTTASRVYVTYMTNRIIHTGSASLSTPPQALETRVVFLQQSIASSFFKFEIDLTPSNDLASFHPFTASGFTWPSTGSATVSAVPWIRATQVWGAVGGKGTGSQIAKVYLATNGLWMTGVHVESFMKYRTASRTTI